jgi:hypothetical protein
MLDHILFNSHQYINNATMNKSFVGYFNFYNKNGLHYKVKDHSPLDLTNKYLLMVYVYFFFVFLYQSQTYTGER